MTEFRTSCRAYCKMMLHALKYPHCTVLGFLIADKKRDDSIVQLVDVVPVGHQCSALSVSIEAALCQIDAHCHSKPPQRVIAGIYVANESLKDKNFDPFIICIAEKVQSHFHDAVLINLDNTAFGIDSDVPCYQNQVYFYSLDSKRWQLKSKEKFILESEESTLEAASSAIQMKLYRELIDFDNHLDNPALDYWNLLLNAKLDSLS